MEANRNIGPRLILAPIRGITDAVYRKAFAHHFDGFDDAIAPFIQPRSGRPLRPAELAQVAPAVNRPMRTVPQVLANDARTFVDAVQALQEAGHDEVNWNLGCPSPNVAGRGRGSGLLPFPERIDDILTRVVGETGVRLSVKMRLGYKEPDEFQAVLEVLNKHPLTEVILHPRIGVQRYRGAVDLDRAKTALALCRHPFVYNGDINDLANFRDAQRRLHGVSGWMLGRGALRCPFLPALIKEASSSTGTCVPPSGLTDPLAYLAILRCFHDDLFEGYGEWLSGPAHLLQRMQGHWSYWAHSFARPKDIAARIRRSKDTEAYRAAVHWAFQQAPAEAPQPFSR